MASCAVSFANLGPAIAGLQKDGSLLRSLGALGMEIVVILILAGALLPRRRS